MDYTMWDPNLGNISLRKAVNTVLGIGNSWFVNELTGSDSNPGTLGAPFATLAAAQAAAVANNGDTVYLIGSYHIGATLTWAKNGVNLVSLSAPSQNGRGRISPTSGLATAFSPLVNVTAQGCNFLGIGTFHGGFTGATGSQVCWAEAGGRNHYGRCDFLGGGDATTAALAGMRSLTIAGQGENEFDDCVIGLDTIVRATNANASLELLSGTPRNLMQRPVFRANVSDTADVHILVGASGMDRDLTLVDPMFINQVGSGASTMAAAISMNTAAGGLILMKRPLSVGATALATSGNVYIDGNAIGATTTGIAILAT